jgi:hypothetical protein
MGPSGGTISVNGELVTSGATCTIADAEGGDLCSWMGMSPCQQAVAGQSGELSATSFALLRRWLSTRTNALTGCAIHGIDGLRVGGGILVDGTQQELANTRPVVCQFDEWPHVSCDLSGLAQLIRPRATMVYDPRLPANRPATVARWVRVQADMKVSATFYDNGSSLTNGPQVVEATDASNLEYQYSAAGSALNSTCSTNEVTRASDQITMHTWMYPDGSTQLPACALTPTP